jgi:arylsulfatase A-like enzyme
VLVAAIALLLVDLWQVTFRAPGSLTIAGVLWLAGLYLATTAAGAAVLQGLIRRSRASTRAVLVAAGCSLFAVESLLRSLSPEASERPIVVAAGVAAGLAMVLPIRALLGRPPRWLAAVATLLLAAGAVGATGGFGRDRDATGAAHGDASSPALRDRPNVLLVVIDTLRADHLGCYGYARPTSPALDRLASEGVLFERAFAQSSWTKPSTASIFTGRFPSQHQALYETSRIPDTETTLPEALGARSYLTAVFSANPWVTPEYGFAQGVDHFFSVYDERFARVTLFMQALKRISQATDGKMRLYNRVKYLVLGELSPTARDTRLVDEALAWLGAHRERRFFAYLHLMSPHHPYDPPPPFDRFVPDRSRPPVKNYPRKSYDFLAHGDPLAPADLADMVARYDGGILYADTETGRLLAGLDRLGLGQTTAVIVTADHGEEFYDHENWGHGQSVYNELVHVPLIVRLPGASATRGRDRTPVAHVDLLPTVLELAGAPPIRGTTGRSLVARLHGAPADGGTVFSELVYRYGTARALVAHDRKLIELRKGDDVVTKLFDLGSDFAERSPLPATSDDAVRLAQALVETVAAAERDRSPASETAIDEDERARLKALGYAR